MISQHQKDAFRENGYFIIEDFLDKSESMKICKEIRLINSSKHLIPSLFFNKMIFDIRFMDICKNLLGDRYGFHHANGQVLPGFNEGKVWHHDYDGTNPWKPHNPMMIHILLYPNGLNESIGCLSVLPKSHLKKVPRDMPNKFGFNYLDGQVNVTGGAGLAVVLNSALWHVRHPNMSNYERCYLNYSYFQYGLYRPERSEWDSRIKNAVTEMRKANFSFKEDILSLDTINGKLEIELP